MATLLRLLLVTGLFLAGPFARAGNLTDRDDVLAALTTGDHARLEELASDHIGNNATGASGEHMSREFFVGVAMYSQSVGPDAADAGITAWLAAVPASEAARLARSTVLLDAAWQLRGTGSNSTVNQLQARRFLNGVSRAQDHHDRIYDALNHRPEWYVIALQLKRSAERDRQTAGLIFEEAARKFPDFEPLYHELLRYLSPRWYGSIPEQAQFIDWAGDYVKAHRSNDSFYAELIRMLLFDVGLAPVVDNVRIDWPRLVSSTHENLALYHDTPLANNMARLACAAREADAARDLMRAIGETPITSIWDGPINLERCRTWLSTMQQEKTTAPHGTF